MDEWEAKPSHRADNPDAKDCAEPMTAGATRTILSGWLGTLIRCGRLVREHGTPLIERPFLNRRRPISKKIKQKLTNIIRIMSEIGITQIVAPSPLPSAQQARANSEREAGEQRPLSS